MNCPTCNYRFDGHEAIVDQKNIVVAISLGADTILKPKPGDCSICLNCAQILEFDSAGKMHSISDEDAPVNVLLYKLQLVQFNKQRRSVQ